MNQSSVKFQFQRLPYYVKSILAVYSAVAKGQKLNFIAGLLRGNQLPKHIRLSRPYQLDLWYLTYLDILVIKEVLLDDCYHIKPGKGRQNSVVDVGAGFGDFSLATAISNSRATVHAYEPDPQYRQLLQRNIQANHLKNIVVHAEAATTLSGIMKTAKRIGVFKIDCEGCEYGIFRRAPVGLLRRIGAVEMEYHEFSPSQSVEEIKKILEKAKMIVKIKPHEHNPAIGLLRAVRDRYGK